ncbi:hypothetical protein GWI33_005706 [Rhynchophorus ferrugineus]|uniref:Uncharacterized protein n=1 Tax=Rhynchophorus ferrugineus TaxID=354439 RepID=A0A834IG31_RHYFE|nr:hypothetical protein GWI33_005706 [Rhynchophorus ferrugineus]
MERKSAGDLNAVGKKTAKGQHLVWKTMGGAESLKNAPRKGGKLCGGTRATVWENLSTDHENLFAIFNFPSMFNGYLTSITYTHEFYSAQWFSSLSALTFTTVPKSSRATTLKATVKVLKGPSSTGHTEAKLFLKLKMNNNSVEDLFVKPDTLEVSLFPHDTSWF